LPISRGDFVLVEYTLTVKDTGEIIDTTSEDLARAKGIYSERERYGPRLVVVGEGRLIKGLEEALEGRNEGDEFEITIPPEKAYGRRDPSKVRILPRRLFERQGVVPEPGRIVEINGQHAVIRQVTGGRVIVDFNHPLAGKTLHAKIRVVKVLRTVEDKIKHLILRRVRLSEDDVGVSYDSSSNVVVVKLDAKALEIPEMQVVKRIVVEEVKRFLSDQVALLRFVEEVQVGEKRAQREGSS
jgi:peptidylprolyl isomerase